MSKRTVRMGLGRNGNCTVCMGERVGVQKSSFLHTPDDEKIQMTLSSNYDGLSYSSHFYTTRVQLDIF